MSVSTIVVLNVGGTSFTTSRQTLTAVGDSFFSSLLSGRISSITDQNGAIFIDRDPDLFKVILNYMRTKHVDIGSYPLLTLIHEAQFYGITPLVRRLQLCQEQNESSCGDALFHAYLPCPSLPIEIDTNFTPHPPSHQQHSRNSSEPAILPSKFRVPSCAQPELKCDTIQQNVVEAYDSTNQKPGQSSVHTPRPPPCPPKPLGHGRTNSDDHNRIKLGPASVSREANTKQLKTELSNLLKIQQAQLQQAPLNPRRVKAIQAHMNWIAVAYPHFVVCYRMKDSVGWQLAHVSERTQPTVQHIALHAKFGNSGQEKMLAAALGDKSIRLWALLQDGHSQRIGTFTQSVGVDRLFFVGSQLVALSSCGTVGIWHGMTANWQVQNLEFPISAFDTAGSFLLLGCTNGSIYYIDMQKFPLRLKDNDLLVTQLYSDPQGDVITAISVYLTPKTNLCGNWIEIAYGTSAGAVRVIVQHPETVGHGPQLFQTFTVHRAPISKVALTTNYLISVCTDYNHVRSWQVTRFRSMISTQPGSTPLASFKVLTLQSADTGLEADANDDVGPFGDLDSEQVFVQKVVPETNKLFVRIASNGDRLCVIDSVDSSAISSYTVHECEASNRMGSRPRRYLLTGHVNGSIQMWDLSTVLEPYLKAKSKLGEGETHVTSLQGPTESELLQLIDMCEITCSSLNNSPDGSAIWN